MPESAPPRPPHRLHPPSPPSLRRPWNKTRPAHTRRRKEEMGVVPRQIVRPEMCPCQTGRLQFLLRLTVPSPQDQRRIRCRPSHRKIHDSLDSRFPRRHGSDCSSTLPAPGSPASAGRPFQHRPAQPAAFRVSRDLPPPSQPPPRSSRLREPAPAPLLPPSPVPAVRAVQCSLLHP